MKSKTILTESTIRIKARIRDIDGDLVDPDDIKFEVKKPGDTSYTEYSLISEGNFIERQDTGIYFIDLIVDQPGRWKYSWFTTGDPQSSYKSFFEAEDSRYK